MKNGLNYLILFFISSVVSNALAKIVKYELNIEVFKRALD